jgi:hypothetical protein
MTVPDKFLSPDLDQARRYLQVLDPLASYREAFDGIPNGFTFQTFDDVKNRKDGKLTRYSWRI